MSFTVRAVNVLTFSGRLAVKLLKAIAEIMLIAVTAFFGYLKHLHTRAYKHIVCGCHSVVR